MTDTTMLDGTAIAEIAALASRAYESEVLDLGLYHIVNLGDRVERIDLTGDQYLDHPKRKKGTTTVRDVASFLAFYEKHADAATEVYADRAARTITAVLDASTGTEARWGAHRLVLQLVHTDGFKAWAGISGKQMSQVDFAEFIEDHRPDVRTPAAADLLELAQDFQATSKATFRSGTVLKSGQRNLQYTEQVDAQAGPNGTIPIPDALELALEVFEGAGTADLVTARFRFRVGTDGKLSLGVILDQLVDVVNSAFEGVVTQLGDGLGTLPGHPDAPPILRGTPVPPAV